ncbi:hypothetical protein BLAT2472_60060 [Burkholderia latens]
MLSSAAKLTKEEQLTRINRELATIRISPCSTLHAKLLANRNPHFGVTHYRGGFSQSKQAQENTFLYQSVRATES